MTSLNPLWILCLAVITRWIDRAEISNVGNYKSIDEDVSEIRIDIGKESVHYDCKNNPFRYGRLSGQ